MKFARTALRSLLLLAALLACARATDVNQCLLAGANAVAPQRGFARALWVDPWRTAQVVNPLPLRYRVNGTSQFLGYRNMNTSPPRGGYSFTSTFQNDDCLRELTQTFDLTESKGVIDSYTASLTQSRGVELEMSVGFEFPIIGGGASGSRKLNMEVSSTQEGKKEVQSTITSTVRTEVPVPPRTNKAVTAVVSVVDFVADYDLSVVLSGDVPTKFVKADGVSALTAIVPVGELLAAGVMAGVPACEGLAPGKPVTVSGVMRGGVGKSVDVTTQTSRMPLDPCNEGSPAQTAVVHEGTAPLATFMMPKPARR